MRAPVSLFAMTVVAGFVVLILSGYACRALEDPPLMLTPDMVDGEWPFLASAVRVSCCPTRG